MNTAEALDLVTSAATPADLFGTDPVHTYRSLAKLLHPDVSAGTADAFARLTALWAQFRGAPVTISSRTRSYLLGAAIGRDDLANTYEVTYGDLPGTDGILKVSRIPSCNDLLANEAAALALIDITGDPTYRAYVPRLIESFSYREPDTGVQRTANVLTPTDGLVSLAAVATAYPDGLDSRDAAWMWRRLLVALSYAHRAGVIHGAVLPDHVLIHPQQHGLMLVNWCYAAIGSASVPAMVDRYADRYPREVRNGEKTGAGTDIHMATGCMTALIGRRIPAALATFARGCTLSALAARPDDAWKLLAELDELLERLYGPRTFRPFAMPPIGAANSRTNY